MLHPAVRASRLAFAVVLLPFFLGSASAPAPRLGTAAAEPALRQSGPPPRTSDSPVVVTATIPCVSGTCQVFMHVPAAAPVTPRPRSTTADQRVNPPSR